MLLQIQDAQGMNYLHSIYSDYCLTKEYIASISCSVFFNYFNFFDAVHYLCSKWKCSSDTDMDVLPLLRWLKIILVPAALLFLKSRKDKLSASENLLIPTFQRRMASQPAEHHPFCILSFPLVFSLPIQTHTVPYAITVIQFSIQETFFTARKPLRT